MTPAQHDVFSLIRKYVYDRRATPTQQTIASKLERTPRSVYHLIKQLKRDGHLETKRYPNGEMQAYGVVVDGRLRWTTGSPKRRQRPPDMSVKHFGGGPIARMHDRDKAEREIAKLYGGLTYTDITSKEWSPVKATMLKRAYARAAE